jgi:FkbM family methyltransferase
MALPKLGRSTVLELRNGTRYFVRAGTLDLGVINEAAFLDPYLGPGFLTLRPDSIVVDIGANIGDFAIQAAKRCPDGRVFAIEPLSFAGKMIETQTRLNGIHNVTWIPAAVSGSEGETTSDAVGGPYKGSGAAEQIRVTTLPQVVRELDLPRIDLLKLDCEGAEWDILPAAEEILPLIQQICMEFHCERGWTPARLSAWLRARGFDVTHTGGSWNGLLWARRAGSASNGGLALRPVDRPRPVLY